MTMQEIDLRGIPTTGREVRITDTAYGFDQNFTSEAAIRRSSYQQTLELLGLYIQFSANDTGPWSTTSQSTDGFFRIASGGAQPSDTSSRWSTAIRLGVPGATGPVGPLGPMGNPGTNGADSMVPGPIGPMGNPGQQGQVGNAGSDGNDGTQGAQGLYSVEIFRNVLIGTASVTPTGGSIVVATAAVVAPSLWASILTPAPTGQVTIISRATVNPGTQTGTITPTWSASFESGGTGPSGPAGPTGAMGAAGNDGNDGADSTVPGPQGNAGQQGQMGAMGDPGQQGQQGPQGATGSQGATGNQGQQGAMGNPGADGQDGAGTSIAWQDETTDLAAVTAVNLAGPGVMGVVAGGVLTITIPGGVQAIAHGIYIGWRIAGAIPSGGQISTDSPSNANTDTDSVTIPDYAGQAVGYIFIWRSDADGGDPSEVHISGGGNSRNLWGAASTRTLAIGGNNITGKAIISVNTFNVALASLETLRIV